MVGPASTSDEALRLIGSAGSLDGALLDVNLGGQPVDDVAAALARHNVPFAFINGGGRESLPHAFRNAILIAKPATPEDLLQVLPQLLQPKNSVAIPFRGRSK